MEQLERIERGGVALVGRVDGSVRFGFTERTGGVSKPPYASLNLGLHVGDDPDAVRENRARALALLGAGAFQDRLIVPRQVHGSRVVVVDRSNPAALAAVRADAAQGADAIVCTAPGVPVLLNFADCVPVILVADDAFAVAHSGWKGTYAGVSVCALEALAGAAGTGPECIHAFIGPHITGAEYEVSGELLARFEERFGSICHGRGGRMLDLGACIRVALEEAGVPSGQIHDPQLSTVAENDRFFSYRREGGVCGRHGALAIRCTGPMV